jgi:hypothetical protein
MAPPIVAGTVWGTPSSNERKSCAGKGKGKKERKKEEINSYRVES